MHHTPSPPGYTRLVLIECRDLWKIYGSSASDALVAAKNGAVREDLMERWRCVLAVAGVSFAVREGEIFVVMGLSGSGKSTLVRHLNRLVEPTAGQVVIGGQDIGLLDADGLRQLRAAQIGMVFQHVALLPHRTVVDNVAFGLELRKVAKNERRKTALGALELVQLEGWGERLPAELSGGMKQRVGLARALVADPPLLLLCEPFSAHGVTSKAGPLNCNLKAALSRSLCPRPAPRRRRSPICYTADNFVSDEACSRALCGQGE